MQYDVASPEAYLAALADDWRRATLLELRELIRSLAPELQEGIAYRMLSYGSAAGPVFALNAQKGYVSLYVGDTTKVDPGGELLAGLDCGKGCIRFKKTTRISRTRIAEFIEQTATRARQGADLSCSG